MTKPRHNMNTGSDTICKNDAQSSTRSEKICSLDEEFHQAPTIPDDSQTCSRTHLMNLLETAKEVGVHNPQAEHKGDDSSFVGSNNTSSSTLRNQSCSTSCEIESFAVVGNSRYLKPAQSLLEEVVSVGGKTIDLGLDKFIGRLTCNGRPGGLGVSPEFRAELYSSKFSSTRKDEIQIRITELIALLDEVEKRYEQYRHEMEEMVSSFELIAGLGAAKSYTALSLQAMSRRFCSLRDDIITQIHSAKRELSKLSLLDQEIRRTQASLQQLGMTKNQGQALRPMKGLSENSVGILRTWLFEHFLHPYPNDSEKIMLASQTGLTKNQVSNWFIKARIQLWKPMIEEICKEEFAEFSIDQIAFLQAAEVPKITQESEEE